MNRALPPQPVSFVLAVMAAVAGAWLWANEPPGGPPAVATNRPAFAPSSYKQSIQPLLKDRCVRCHGPNEPEGGLDLSRAVSIIKGGESGPILAETAEQSLLWQRVAAGEMPPDRPLAPDEQETLRGWITAGKPGLSAAAAAGGEHWAFAPLRMPPVPQVPADGVRTAVDAHLQAALAERGLALSPDADRATLARRLAFVLTGLPPTPDEVAAFVADPAADAYERLVDRLLASPQFGVHWGKHWLDAAGYADTDGYFSSDNERKHGWRYRDYVVASINADKPFDRFVREQLAGDEIACVVPGTAVTPEQRELLVATHFLRNAPDGTDDSAPSPESKRIDRYAALEATEQVVYTSLLGLTIKCARCHDHKFEPLTQREYYQAQSIFYPAFNVEKWVTPKKRVIHAATADELAAWREQKATNEARLAAIEAKHRAWVAANRPRGLNLFGDAGTAPAAAGPAWTAAPEGSPPVRFDAGGIVVAADTESWLATPPIQWIDPEVGAAVAVTFDLVADRATPAGDAAVAIAYVLAATDVRGCPPEKSGGNIYIEGRPAGGPRVYRLRNAAAPADRFQSLGNLGSVAYRPGATYGVRVTNLGGGKCRLEHLVDHAVDGSPLILDHADLPPAPFALYRYPGRDFVVANVAVERHAPPSAYRGDVLFVDDGTKPVADLWSDAAPGDAPPELAVLLANAVPNRHCVDRRGTKLRIVVGMTAESWLCTKQSFDWTPDAVGRSMQASFLLVDDTVNLPGGYGQSSPAAHVGYYLGANNFGRRRADAPGNLLVSEGKDGPARVSRSYPGGSEAALGEQRLVPGRRYGVRVTNAGGGVYHLVHLVDDVPDGPPLELSAADLPDGAFAFFYGADRSFVVENVIVAAGDLAQGDAPEAVKRARQFADRSREHRAAVAAIEKELAEPAGVPVSWVTDLAPEPPPVFLLRRGQYGEHGDEVTPAGLAVLDDPDHPFAVVPPPGGRSTGRRLALADWLLREGSRPLALVARVRANWIWLHCFGTGLSTTPENFGLSGQEPSHPELLEFLAAEFVRSGWSLKRVLRTVLCSTAFRQASAAHAAGLEADPSNRLVWRFPVQRLDAESIRDAMLAVSGGLDDALGGPPVGLKGVLLYGAKGEVEPDEPPGPRRRTLYVQRRRSVLPTFLEVFDLPSIQDTCAERPRSTVALQSLAQLNSAFSRGRAAAFADRLIAAADNAEARVDLAFSLCTGRGPAPADREAAVAFLAEQRAAYAPAADAPRRALVDFCQIMFLSNAFLYVE